MVTWLPWTISRKLIVMHLPLNYLMILYLRDITISRIRMYLKWIGPQCRKDWQGWSNIMHLRMKLLFTLIGRNFHITCKWRQAIKRAGKSNCLSHLWVMILMSRIFKLIILINWDMRQSRRVQILRDPKLNLNHMHHSLSLVMFVIITKISTRIMVRRYPRLIR